VRDAYDPDPDVATGGDLAPASLAVMVTGTAASGAHPRAQLVTTDSVTSPTPSMWIEAPPLAPLRAASTAASPAGESAGSTTSAPNAPAPSSLASVDASVRPRATTDRCTSPVAGRYDAPERLRAKPIRWR